MRFIDNDYKNTNELQAKKNGINSNNPRAPLLPSHTANMAMT